jgi:hypothetical protein
MIYFSAHAEYDFKVQIELKCVMVFLELNSKMEDFENMMLPKD